MNPIRLSDYEIRTSGRECYNNHVSLLTFTSLKKEADFDKTIIINKSFKSFKRTHSTNTTQHDRLDLKNSDCNTSAEGFGPRSHLA